MSVLQNRDFSPDIGNGEELVRDTCANDPADYSACGINADIREFRLAVHTLIQSKALIEPPLCDATDNRRGSVNHQ
jgi:hypothetical protein